MNIFRKIFKNKTQTDFPGGYIPHRFIMENIKQNRVLVVGDYTGRDFPTIKKIFPETYLLDIVNNHLSDKFYFCEQTIEKKTPYSKQFFDTIVIFEVLEHLWEDFAAMKEINRILKNDGNLLVSVPFYHDDDITHYRIHSRKTIEKLLQYSGFTIIKYSYRGLCNRVSNKLIALISLILYPIYKEKALKTTNSLNYYFHTKLSKHHFLNSLTKRFGIMILANKIRNNKFNAIENQKKVYKK